MRNDSAERYYEQYWSDTGYQPTGRTTPFLADLFQARMKAGWTCLDVGCGDGRTAGLWLRDYGCTYTGVDMSQHAVDAAQALGLDARKVDGLESLPFPAASFDAAVCIEVIEHLFLPQLAVAEISRVLKPGGVLIVTTPNVAYWRARVDLAFLGRWNPGGDNLALTEPWRDPHIRFFSCDSLRRMLVQAGFGHVEVGGHYGSIIRDLPWLGRRLWRGRWGTQSSQPYRTLEVLKPSLFGYRLDAVATRSFP